MKQILISNKLFSISTDSRINFLAIGFIITSHLVTHKLCATILNTPIANPSTLSEPVNQRPDYKWSSSSYAGYAWSGLSGITNPNTNLFNKVAAGDSDNSPLGNVPYAGFSLGRRIGKHVIFSFGYDVYGAFGYRRSHVNATMPTQMAGVEILGSNYVRSFVLDHQAAIFTIYLDVPNKWGVSFKNMHIKPIAGAGLGVGISKVRGFQTVGYSSTAPYSQITTQANVHTSKSLAGNVSVGLILWSANSAVSFGMGYRYSYGGKFESGDNFVLNDNYNQGREVKLAAWTGKLKTQELRIYVNAEF
jgi:hypothetical protein